jgi:hypothetical protein
MSTHNPLDSRKTNPCSFKITGCMQSLEWGKELVLVGHIKACAVVSHEEERDAILSDHPELDIRVEILA